MNRHKSDCSRREFLRSATAGGMALGALALSKPAFAAVDDDLTFASALDAAKAIASKKVSSVELTEHLIARNQKAHGELNAIVVDMSEKARKRAKEADAAQARGESWGPLHGVPMTLKESYDVEGELTTVGFPALKNNRATENAVVTERMLGAGAVLLGKTNVPLFLTDLQSYNAIYGTTNNPWDTTRTCGGSTGGGATSLAAGLSYLSIGSDIGGSVRIPANFCGVFSHKTSLNVIPSRGHVPPLPTDPPQPPAELPVLGPLARSADDLLAALQILGGPEGDAARAYSWKLPAARKSNIADFKIGYVLDDPFCPVSAEVREPLEKTVDVLRKAGATVTEGWPDGVEPAKQLETYVSMLLATLPPIGIPSEKVYADYAELLGREPLVNLATVAKQSININHREYQKRNAERMTARLLWQQYFSSFDAFLMPVTCVPAFPHDHSPVMSRTLKTPEGERPYFDLLSWISFATLTGLPASVAPAGRTAGGLPVGIQILGPFLEDATPIAVARHIEELTGGFTPPPDFPA